MAESSDIAARDARTAAEFSADVMVEQIARVYAQAALDAAENQAASADLVAELESLLADVLDRLPKFEAVLASARVGYEEKAALIDKAFQRQGSPLLKNFLKVLARHGRLDCLRAIVRQTRRLFDQRSGVVDVRLTTAAELDPKVQTTVTAALQQSLGGRPRIVHSVDAKLIGGAVLRIGDTVYDGSVAAQLKQLRQQMIDRSAHEIQSRRDRFRHPAGN